MYNRAFKKIEYFLYNYDYIEKRIENLELGITDSEYNNSYEKWIKNKSSGIEDLVVRNTTIERKILKLKKWKLLIETILQRYKETNILKYNFIILKYFKKSNFNEIYKEIGLDTNEQKRLRTEILQHVFSIALKKGILVQSI